jgi:hypothetical protein
MSDNADRLLWPFIRRWEETLQCEGRDLTAAELCPDQPRWHPALEHALDGLRAVHCPKPTRQSVPVRLGHWCRRNPALIAFACLAFCFLMTTIYAGHLLREEREERSQLQVSMGFNPVWLDDGGRLMLLTKDDLFDRGVWKPERVAVLVGLRMRGPLEAIPVVICPAADAGDP